MSPSLNDPLLASLDTGEDIPPLDLPAQMPEEAPAPAAAAAAEPEPAPAPAPAPAPEATPEPAPEPVQRTVAPAPAGLPVTDPAQRAAAEPAPAPAAAEGGRQVPLAALLEERARWRAESEAQAARIRALEQQQAQAKPATEPAPKAPEFTEDPQGYVDAVKAETRQQLEAVQQRNAQQEAALAELRLNQAVQAAEREIAERQPDWQQALNHLRVTRYQELKLAFPEATEAQVLNTITAEERQVAQVQVAAGRNPYDYAYQLAKLRGYTAPVTPAPAPPVEALRGNAPPPAATDTGASRGPRTLPADTTLNAVSGAPPDDAEDIPDDIDGILKLAQREALGRRKAS